MNCSEGQGVNLTAMTSEMNSTLAFHLSLSVSAMKACGGEEIAYDMVAIALAKVWIAALADLTGLGACRKSFSGQSQDGSKERQLHDEVLEVGYDILKVLMEDSSVLMNYW